MTTPTTTTLTNFTTNDTHALQNDGNDGLLNVFKIDRRSYGCDFNAGIDLTTGYPRSITNWSTRTKHTHTHTTLNTEHRTDTTPIVYTNTPTRIMHDTRNGTVFVGDNGNMTTRQREQCLLGGLRSKTQARCARFCHIRCWPMRNTRKTRSSMHTHTHTSADTNGEAREKGRTRVVQFRPVCVASTAESVSR